MDTFFLNHFAPCFLAFMNIFISNVHCFCPCCNSFVVMDWEIAMIHIWLCVANWWRLKKGAILQWPSWANAVFIRWGIFWWKAGTCACWDRQGIIQLVYTRYSISIWEIYNDHITALGCRAGSDLPTISHHYPLIWSKHAGDKTLPTLRGCLDHCRLDLKVAGSYQPCKHLCCRQAQGGSQVKRQIVNSTQKPSGILFQSIPKENPIFYSPGTPPAWSGKKN